MTATDLSRETAIEAVRRGAPGNVHELWALLEHLDGVRPALIVDIGSAPALWWAWWSLCRSVIGVARPRRLQEAFPGERLPSSLIPIDGDPDDRATALRVTDQLARRPLDVLILSPRGEAEARAVFALYAPKVREGGQVIVHGIADPALPGVGRFWNGLETDDRQELIGERNPDGYGIVTVPRKVSSNG